MTEQFVDTREDNGTKYKRGEVIGVGGFGLVYEAYDQEREQKVVIKVLKRKNKEETFKKEINIMKQINHPSVITLLDTFHSQDNVFCAVMNYAENGSILSDIMRHGTYSEDKMKAYMKSILEGLDAIHQAGIIHNDIKAANILLNKGKAMIADFGASIDTKVTKNLKSSVGSPHWMSPETACGKPLSTKSDIWSIGILAIEMLTGKPPLSNFPGSTVLLILKETKKVPVSLKVSDICLSFIKMCLQSNPKYRPNAADLLYHPFIMESANLSGNGQKSCFYIDLANKISEETDQFKLTKIIDENQDKILCSSKIFSEENNQFILFETIALFSEEVNGHLISTIIENLLKIDDNHIPFDEIVKIIFLYIEKVKNKDQVFNKYGLLDFLAKESVKESPLLFIIQEQIKDMKIIGIDEALSFISGYRYECIFNNLIKFYQSADIPRRLRLLLNEKMHKITSKSLSSALSIINFHQLNENQIKMFCNFFNVVISKNITKENTFLIMNILDNSPLSELGYNQQNRVSSFVLSCCINQNYHKQIDDLIFIQIIEKALNVIEKLNKINISNELEKKSEFWQVLYQNQLLHAISTFANKCPSEFEKNIDIDAILKMFKNTIEFHRHEEIECFVSTFKNSAKLCSSFVFDSIFIDFSKSLDQISKKHQDNYLKIIYELIKLTEKPSNFHICLKGPLSKISIFGRNQYASNLLKLLDEDIKH